MRFLFAFELINKLLLFSLALSDNYEQEIYAADGITKILSSMKTYEDELDAQIIGCKTLAHLSLDGIFNISFRNVRIIPQSVLWKNFLKNFFRFLCCILFDFCSHVM